MTQAANNDARIEMLLDEIDSIAKLALTAGKTEAMRECLIQIRDRIKSARQYAPLLSGVDEATLQEIFDGTPTEWASFGWLDEDSEPHTTSLD